jgi:hypothetical protein
MHSYEAVGLEPYVMLPGSRLEVGPGGHLYETLGTHWPAGPVSQIGVGADEPSAQDILTMIQTVGVKKMSTAQLETAKKVLTLAAAVPMVGEAVKGSLAAVEAELKARKGGLPSWLLPVALVGGVAAVWFLTRKKKG